ncbi:cation:proton antiporter [Bacillus sp. NTK071]|uniref:cation:proton antiporter n=1 Tax=Bacillus sp. NTK071 TaxID=2802175 RepID=UPI001A8EDE4A|nr:cation:proton antiporter [Bacillus sp. NTK071]MBN8209133.1 cation:proton antiporter [Bacillus sp. NTK071]
MEHLDMHHIFELGLILTMIAAGITAIAKKLKQPYPIALVIIGTLIGLLNIPVLEPLKMFITEGDIFNFVILTIFLPALLGEAALKLPFSHLNENKKPIIALAFGGTFLSFIVIGFSTHYLLGLSIPVAFVFAALMSATDPVSVLSIFKSMGVNHKLSTVIEGESLFNDGLAVVLFKISAFSLLAYIDMGLGGLTSGSFEFIKVVIGGVLVGGGLGYGISILTKYFDDYPLEIIFSILLFYGSYIIAESIHVSGVIAVVVGALTFGNFGSRVGMSPTTRLNINNFWDVAALLANSIVFLMVGLEITRINFADQWGTIGLALLIVLVGRTIAVYGSTLPIRSLPWSWRHVLNWGGLKGSLSIALALSLPSDFTGRDTVLILTFSIVLFSLVVQGLTIKPLISYFGLRAKHSGSKEYEDIVANLHRHEAGIAEIRKLKTQLFVPEPVFSEMLTSYQSEIDKSHTELDRLLEENPELKTSQLITLKKHSLYAQYDKITELEQEEIISGEVAWKYKEIVNNGLSNLEETDVVKASKRTH